MNKLNLKSLTIFTLTSSILITIASCGGGSSTETTTSTADAEEFEAPDEDAAACIWDNVAVRETPTEKGKYLTAISIGEMVTFVEDEKDTADKFIKVRLNDGKEGWARKDFVLPRTTSFVFINDADVYNRPDALTKTDKKFSKYDIIAVISTKGDFAEVKGKRSEGKWIETAWVKMSNLTQQKIDIASAKFIKKALAAETDEAKIKGLEEILNNSDLSGSAFLSDLPELISELKGSIHERSVDYESTLDSTASQ